MGTTNTGTVVVGAGHAGAQIAASLLTAGYDAGITVLSDELVMPHDRPSLSKRYLSGECEVEDILLRRNEFWDSPGAQLVRGVTVASVDADAHTVATLDGRSLRYDTLVWAAGGRARKLTVPGADLGGVHTVRGHADAECLRAEAANASHAVIVGGGFIGLEVAASLRRLGLGVTVLEVADRLLGRVTGPVVADHLGRRHRNAGVDLRLDTGVEEITGEAGRVTGVRLVSGEWVRADLVVVGIGLVPNVDVLAAAGARTDDGIEVDELCRTSLPDVLAVGDAVRFPIPLYDGRRVRLESVQNASEQAKVAARVIMGNGAPYDPVPWFWSHQYDVRFQTVGLLTDHDEAVVRGDPASGSFSVVYTRHSRVLAVDAVNCVRDFAQARALVGADLGSDRAGLADATVPLKSLSRRAPRPAVAPNR